ncbi:hypothetical protein [Tenacibaculum finnmarkense]|uniref:Uncharacterized protein n=1 Tax=Tenacibaculum finnmarkense genomovar ulcerans TaxID=2781388 RepID=A0A2I2MAH9_9FLAO|nr:hypothetical protein [Tenacibaculum finnmarkense]MBE7696878.1 hypothetical protein [Tenacibaculum finnmarkense genomovar ulcerans]MCD8440359.1 hypothetical protein [Tenacibaculum finnmarkense genomovar ulcerans]MCG8743026.1 hypothetical protein [Tenacibaculum finnmarkense]SOS55089.1 conserved hypothetical protein [Tenacibaculum finnmarkense]SOU88934.1 conserved hypothetical protein [Tenacibaculum finnmarkense genomovar ulcerans]
MYYEITTDGISNENNEPYFLKCKKSPLEAIIKDFKRLLLLRGLEIPTDLIAENNDTESKETEIVLKYSFLDSEDAKEKVKLTFKVSKKYEF